MRQDASDDLSSYRASDPGAYRLARTFRKYPASFFLTTDEESILRVNASRLNPSAVITPAHSFDEYVRQLMVPRAVTELARKASGIRLSAWELDGIRAQLEPTGGGLLRKILEEKIKDDDSHPPYIRVACTGKGDYDDLADEYGHAAIGHHGDAGSPVVLEIWPAQHYSPIHAHGGATGIIYCLAGQIDVMIYSALHWNAEKLALVTLTPGQCAWLAGDRFGVHKVYCPMDGGSRSGRPRQPTERNQQLRSDFARLPYRKRSGVGRAQHLRRERPRNLFFHQREDTRAGRFRHLFRSFLACFTQNSGWLCNIASC